jgi:hypothetical protein
MMIVHYDPASGRPDHIVTTYDPTYRDWALEQPNTIEASTAAPIDTIRVVEVDGAPSVVLRPPAPAIAADRYTVPADGATPVTLTGIPAGAAVAVSGPQSSSLTTDGSGDLVLVFVEPGTYAINIESWPARAVLIGIEATAP